MRTSKNINIGIFVLLFLLSEAQTTGVRRLGTKMGRLENLQVGHGVTEGNGPTGLYGFFGCLFNYAVCQKDEICVNDNLFGSCQRIGTLVDNYQYNLREDQVLQLETEVEQLIRTGYKWKDLYTQCVLGNVLLAFELNQHYDSNFCKHKSQLIPTEVTTDNDLLPLNELYQQTSDLTERADLDDYDDKLLGLMFPKRRTTPDLVLYSRSLKELERPLVFSLSKDDFVNVHKYQKSKKHQPFDGQMTWQSSSPSDAHLDLLRSLTPEELDLLNHIVMKNHENGDLSKAADEDYYGSYDEGDDDNVIDDYGIQDHHEELNDGLSIDVPSDPEQTEDEDEAVREEFLDRSSRMDFDQNSDYPVDENSERQDQLREKEKLRDLLENEDRLEDNSAFQSKQYSRLADESSLNDQNILEGNDYIYNYLESIRNPVSHSPDNNVYTDRSSQTDRVLDSKEGNRSPDGEKLTEVMPNKELVPSSGAFLEKSGEEELREVRGTVVTSPVETATSKAKYDIVDTSYAYLSVVPKTSDPTTAANIVAELQELLQLPSDSFSHLSVYKGDINFRINRNLKGLNASSVAAGALSLSNELKNRTSFQVVGAGVGHVSETYISVGDIKVNGHKYFLLTFVLCGVIAGVVLAVILLYVIRRHRLSKDKLAHLAQSAEKVGPEASKEYQDLCRHHMQSKLSEKPEPLHVAGRVGSVSAVESATVHSPSSRSSTSSWSEEPVTTSMDISTGHIILSYMEDHLKNKDRLDEEWEALHTYEPEVCDVSVASLPQNERKNRYSDILPYDHSRVVLHAATNMTGSDYINASTITDHDPRNPAYLVTQGPLPNTVADFWQMVWEQGSVVIVNLTKLTEQGTSLCHCYWPSEGSDLYHIYEVHLVSEHIWCEDYLVRSFYLKNLQTNETRTVTQFHFLTWPDMKIPGSSKALLDFRRKVNKSYRGRSCPVLVHCSDGAGRSGTYCLIDMVLNRMTKGAKEIDIAATLEHIRDQRMQMVKTKEQFQFVLATVAEEVHAILKALPQ